MPFYALFDVDPGAPTSAIMKAFRAMSLLYHPDKGGDVECFKYIKRVQEILCNQKLHQQYDERGKSSFDFDDFGHVNQPCVEVPAPPINSDFMKEVAAMQGAHKYCWGSVSLSDALMAEAVKEVDVLKYAECELATQLGKRLRLIGERGKPPVYSLPRLVRFAAFMGMELTELDLPSAHGRQILRYARQHRLERGMLEAAFATAESTESFRAAEVFATLGLLPKDVKLAVNMICYGNSLKQWRKKRGLAMHLFCIPLSC